MPSQTNGGGAVGWLPSSGSLPSVSGGLQVELPQEELSLGSAPLLPPPPEPPLQAARVRNIASNPTRMNATMTSSFLIVGIPKKSCLAKHRFEKWQRMFFWLPHRTESASGDDVGITA